MDFNAFLLLILIFFFQQCNNVVVVLALNCGTIQGAASICLSLNPVTPLRYVNDDFYRYDHSSVSNGSTVYIYGGTDTSSNVHKGKTTDYIRLNIININDDNGLIQYEINKTTVNVGLMDQTTVLYKDSVYVFGGILDSFQYTNTLWEFRSFPPVVKVINIDSIKPPERAGHSAILYNSKMIIFGGRDIERYSMNDVFYFDLKPLYDARINMTEWAKVTSNWTFCDTSSANAGSSIIPKARYDHSAILYNTQMYIYGGINKDPDSLNTEIFNDVYVLNLNNWNWNKLTTRYSTGGRHRHSASLYKSTMIIYGGLMFAGSNKNDQPTNNMLQLDLITTIGGRYDWKLVNWELLNTSKTMVNNPEYPIPVSDHSTAVVGNHLLRIFGDASDIKGRNDIQFISLCSCSLCARGTFINESTVQCHICPDGMYGTEYGATNCKDCSVGFYSINDMMLNDGTKCLPCESGKFTNHVKSNICKKCETGRYNDRLNSTFCHVCEVGKYNDETAQLKCKHCSIGMYNPNNESRSVSNCLPCSPGYYQDAESSFQCKKCPARSFSVKKSNDISHCQFCTQPKFCIEGEGLCYANRDEQSFCQSCLSNKYKSFIGICKTCSNNNSFYFIFEVFISLCCIFSIFLVLWLVQRNDMKWHYEEEILKNRLKKQHEEKEEAIANNNGHLLHDASFIWIRHFQILFLLIQAYEIPKIRANEDLTFNFFNRYMPIYSLSMSKFTTYYLSFLACNPIAWNPRSLLLFDMFFAPSLLLLFPTFANIYVLIDYFFIRHHNDSFKRDEKVYIRLMNGVIVDIWATICFPIVLVVTFNLLNCVDPGNNDNYRLYLDGGQCIWNLDKSFMHNIKEIQTQAGIANEGNYYNNYFVEWLVFLCLCIFYLCIYYIRLIVDHLPNNIKAGCSKCCMKIIPMKCLHFSTFLTHLFATPINQRNPWDDIVMTIVIGSRYVTDTVAIQMVILIIVICLRIIVFLALRRKKCLVDNKKKCQVKTRDVASFCLFLLQLSICIIYLIRENENNSSNKRNNSQIINADNVDETVAIAFTYHIDIVYLISSLSFVILTTVFLCQKWYFNRIIRNEKRKDLLFHPKKQVIYFPLYILCITCMLPSIAFCCLYHLLRILLYFIYSLFRQCFEICTKPEEKRKYNLFSQNLKQCKYELFNFVSTIVYLYYEFAGSCEACQSIFGVTYYMEEDYLADDLWRKHMENTNKTSAKVKPLDDDEEVVRNSRNNDRSILAGFKKNRKGNKKRGKKKKTKKLIEFEEIKETGNKKLEDHDSFYGIWGEPPRS